MSARTPVANDRQSAAVQARRTGGARGVQLAALAAIVLIGAVSIGLSVHPFGGGSKRIEPPPTLFPDRVLVAGREQLRSARPKAKALVASWFRTHSGRQDRAFAAFVLRSLPRPPSRSAQRSELRRLRTLAATRTPGGDSAARWLERYGNKRIWKLFATQYAQLAPHTRGTLAKKTTKQAIKFAKGVVTAALPRFRRLAPYEADRGLADFGASADQRQRLAALSHHGRPRYSYPSKHAAGAAAGSAVLEVFDRHRGPEFEWMASEIAYSRMYAGGHFPSDVAAGALIGYMAADYELHVNGLAR